MSDTSMSTNGTEATPEQFEQLRQEYNAVFQSYVEACRALGEATVSQRFLSSRVQQLEAALHEAEHKAQPAPLESVPSPAPAPAPKPSAVPAPA